MGTYVGLILTAFIVCIGLAVLFLPFSWVLKKIENKVGELPKDNKLQWVIIFLQVFFIVIGLIIYQTIKG